MSEEPADRRVESRFLTELDLVLFDLSGIVIDERAQAHDVTSKGFRAETRVKLPEKSRVRFALKIEENEVRGEAVVVWVAEDQWGWFNAGVKITKISWADSRKLRKRVQLPGFDFVNLAKKAAIAAYWVIVVIGIQAALQSPHIRHTLIKLGPVVPAVVLLGFALTMMMNRDD
jgi:hypothetical protein